MLKKVKTILLRGLFYLMALQILNFSIDIDYITNSNPALAPASDFDDMDSFLELLVEKAMGDDDYTSEDDDDSGDAHEKGLEKYNNGPLCFEQYARPLVYPLAGKSTWTAGIDNSNRLCKGYFSIITPPPDIA